MKNNKLKNLINILIEQEKIKMLDLRKEDEHFYF